MQNLENYALYYAAKGFSVLPVKGKQPIIKFANKPPLTADDIKKIWNLNPTSDIALKTDKFFVIDVDRHGAADGLQSLSALGHDDWFKDTLTAATASGGYHFYFKKPDGVEIKQNIGILKGVDIKAHKNNYILVAPSKNGGYRWLNKAPIKEPPDGLLKWILEKQNKHTFLKYASHSPAARSDKVAKTFEQVVNGLGDSGTRNASLTTFCGTLLGYGVEVDSVVKLCELANNATPDPLPEREVAKTLNSIIDRELAKHT